MRLWEQFRTHEACPDECDLKHFLADADALLAVKQAVELFNADTTWRFDPGNAGSGTWRTVLLALAALPVHLKHKP